MNGRRPSNVIPMRPGHAGQAHERLPDTTILHAVADDDGLAEVAPVAAALTRRSAVRQLVVHGGASSRFAEEGLACVDRFLAIPGGTIAERTAAALTAFEAVLVRERPDVVVATGDDDVMVAAAMAAVKLRIAVAHLASGLRCWDWQLPDEVNRTVIDRLSDTLFTFSADAAANLRDEGVPDGRIHPVGNTRIDTLRRHEPAARARAAWDRLGLAEHGYTLVALQRPETLAAPEGLASALAGLAVSGPVVLLRHPRTGAAIDAGETQALLAGAGVRSVGPFGYVGTLSLLAGAGAVLTDAGIVQDDASALGVRCYTLLQATPRTITLTHGTNVLLGDDPSAISHVRPSAWATPAAIPMWDGHAGDRIADALVANYTLAAVHAGDR